MQRFQAGSRGIGWWGGVEGDAGEEEGGELPLERDTGREVDSGYEMSRC